MSDDRLDFTDLPAPSHLVNRYGKKKKAHKNLAWNKTQKKLLLQVCKLHKAFKPTLSHYITKWKLVAVDLGHTAWFFGCGEEYWLDYMNAYNTFREEILKKYEIDFENVSQSLIIFSLLE